jgi:predicted TIM-barrel fold metal-dependent hydrolase
MTRVISADCHINEPPHVFERVPEQFRDRAPKMRRAPDGGDGWSFDGQVPKRSYGVEAMAGKAAGDKISGLTFDEIMPGNYDGAAHVSDMDVDGVDVSIVYPGSAIFVYMEADRELALACTRSYNDWALEEFQGADPKRLVALPMIPVDHGMDVAVAELRRTLAKGARAGFIPGLPTRPYHDPYYDPLWAAAAEVGVPLTFHRTFGGRPQEADYDELVDQKISAAGTVYRFFSGVRPLTYMVFGGVFDRHPSLRIVAAEVNMGWIPFWGQTMDQGFDNEYYKGTGGVTVVKKPSEYLGVNVFVTVLDDDIGFRMIAEGLYPALADTAMFSTDYPHSVCLWPNSRQHIERLTAGLSDVDREKVLHGNAARVYGL